MVLFREIVDILELVDLITGPALAVVGILHLDQAGLCVVRGIMSEVGEDDLRREYSALCGNRHDRSPCYGRSGTEFVVDDVAVLLGDDLVSPSAAEIYSDEVRHRT